MWPQRSRRGLRHHCCSYRSPLVSQPAGTIPCFHTKWRTKCDVLCTCTTEGVLHSVNSVGKFRWARGAAAPHFRRQLPPATAVRRPSRSGRPPVGGPDHGSGQRRLDATRCHVSWHTTEREWSCRPPPDPHSAASDNGATATAATVARGGGGGRGSGGGHAGGGLAAAAAAELIPWSASVVASAAVDPRVGRGSAASILLFSLLRDHSKKKRRTSFPIFR